MTARMTPGADCAWLPCTKFAHYDLFIHAFGFPEASTSVDRTTRRRFRFVHFSAHYDCSPMRALSARFSVCSATISAFKLMRSFCNSRMVVLFVRASSYMRRKALLSCSKC